MPESEDVLSVGDQDALDRVAADYFRGELIEAAERVGGAGSKASRLILAALDPLPWVGAFAAAMAAIKEDGDRRHVDVVFRLWLESHEEKLARLRSDLEQIVARLANLGADVDERIQSEEYLRLVRKTFAAWDRADTAEKRKYLVSLLTNTAGGEQIADDDMVRMFIEWIDQYNEAHFKIIAQIFNHAHITRRGIWTGAFGPVPRDNSAEADLFKRLTRDLQIGDVIRQERETNHLGQFYRVQRQKRSGPPSQVLESPFDDDDPYELTELGKKFVHYAMTDLVPRIGNAES